MCCRPSSERGGSSRGFVFLEKKEKFFSKDRAIDGRYSYPLFSFKGVILLGLHIRPVRARFERRFVEFSLSGFPDLKRLGERPAF